MLVQPQRICTVTAFENIYSLERCMYSRLTKNVLLPQAFTITYTFYCVTLHQELHYYVILYINALCSFILLFNTSSGQGGKVCFRRGREALPGQGVVLDCKADVIHEHTYPSELSVGWTDESQQRRCTHLLGAWCKVIGYTTERHWGRAGRCTCKPKPLQTQTLHIKSLFR